MADATYTIHIGPGMQIDGGPFGGTRVEEVRMDDEEVVVSYGGGESGVIGSPADFNQMLRDLIAEGNFSISPVSKGAGVYSIELDFSGDAIRFVVRENDPFNEREFDPEEAAENRPVTMQRDFDRGRVYVEGY